MKLVPSIAPFKGVYEQAPYLAIQSPYCQNLINYNVTRAGIELRNGDSVFSTFEGDISANRINRVFTYGDSKVIVITYNQDTLEYDFFDGETGALEYSTSTTPGVGYFYPLYFNNYLFMSAVGSGISSTLIVQYDGSSFGLAGYTGSGLKAYGGNVYKNRSYWIQRDEAAYWYSDIEAITGALTKVSLEQIIKNKSTLSIIATTTISDQITSEVFQAFIMQSGEVLFYSGSYPNSSDWGLVGEAKIGRPLDFNSYIPYQGDSLIICDTGVVSLRDLFLKGSNEASSLTVSGSAEKTWNSLVQEIRNQKDCHYAQLSTIPLSQIGIDNVYSTAITGTWDAINNRIIINFPWCLDPDSNIVFGNFQFIYSTIEQAWYYHQSWDEGSASWEGYDGIARKIGDICRYQNKILMLSQASGTFCLVEKEGSNNFTDRNTLDDDDIGLYYEMITAPVYNAGNSVQKAESVDIISESDLYDVTNFTLIQDFGVRTTLSQKLPSSLPSTLQRPNINVGIEANYVQLKISGITNSDKTVGQKIYGINFWINDGGRPR